MGVPENDCDGNAGGTLRDHFLGWQCRIRQHCHRHAGGRPTNGMRPTVSSSHDHEALAQVTVLIVKRDCEHITAQFRHMVKKTFDPAERFASAMNMLAAAYYQQAREFADEMTALFAADSVLAKRLVAEKTCTLRFDQFNQRYALQCQIRNLEEHHPYYQATYWHNRLFNSHMPSGVMVLGIQPLWSVSKAEPPVG